MNLASPRDAFCSGSPKRLDIGCHFDGKMCCGNSFFGGLFLWWCYSCIPQNGWSIMEDRIQMDDLEENPPFKETPISRVMNLLPPPSENERMSSKILTIPKRKCHLRLFQSLFFWVHVSFRGSKWLVVR